MKKIVLFLSLLWGLSAFSANVNVIEKIISSRHSLDAAATYKLEFKSEVRGYETFCVYKTFWFYNIQSLTTDASVFIDIGNYRENQRSGDDHYCPQSIFLDMQLFKDSFSFSASYYQDKDGIGYLLKRSPAGAIIWNGEHYALLDETEVQIFKQGIFSLFQVINSSVKQHEVSLAAQRSYKSPFQQTRMLRYKDGNNFWVSQLMFFENYEKDSVLNFMKRDPDTIIYREYTDSDYCSQISIWSLRPGYSLVRKIITERQKDYVSFMIMAQIGAKEYEIEVDSKGRISSCHIKKNGEYKIPRPRYAYTRQVSVYRWLNVGVKKRRMDEIKTAVMTYVYAL